MKTTINLGLLLLTLVSFNLAAQDSNQTCRGNILETAPASRFTINNDGTVTDTQTDLIWARCPQGFSGAACTDTSGIASFNWTEALALNGTRPTSVTTGSTSGTDWRLPNVKELTSLVERACDRPTINATIFPNNGNTFFWSASPVASNSDGAWGVFFSSGSVGDFDRFNVLRVRLVRGGQ